MIATDFIQNVYKGTNLDECEEHLKDFCKQKIQELIPEHFEATKKYQEIAESHKSLFEDCKNCNEEDDDEDDDDDDIKESSKDKFKEKIEAALKRVPKFNKIVEFDFDDDPDDSSCVFVASFRVKGFEAGGGYSDDMEEVDEYEEAVIKALKSFGKFELDDQDDTKKNELRFCCFELKI